jgi:hypothetical protein
MVLGLIFRAIICMVFVTFVITLKEGIETFLKTDRPLGILVCLLGVAIGLCGVRMVCAII